MNPFDVWAPMFRAPFSGDVIQEISPQLFSQEIKGIPKIEYRVQTEVASYGKQLGKILEALQALSEAVNEDLPEIEQLIKDVERVKVESVEEMRADAEAALKRLRKADEDAWQQLVSQGEM